MGQGRDLITGRLVVNIRYFFGVLGTRVFGFFGGFQVKVKKFVDGLQLTSFVGSTLGRLGRLFIFLVTYRGNIGRGVVQGFIATNFSRNGGVYHKDGNGDGVNFFSLLGDKIGGCFTVGGTCVCKEGQTIPQSVKGYSYDKGTSYNDGLK